MKPPQISGYELKGEIGEGASGTVYSAHKNGGGYFAVKVFESMSSNPSLLESRMMRIVDGGAEEAVVPILARALEARPACVVMPLLGDKVAGDDESEYLPSTLQTRLGDFLKTEESWEMLTRIAEQLAVLHRVRVAHGNLKPGNIFLNEAGEPLLSDYAEGLMPGVHHLAYSDALLYAPPEQLREPEAYLEEKGYRWDVYAFGVLAYRLMTGSFPRCDEMFQQVSPAPGENERFMIEADHEGIAQGLEAEEIADWPSGPTDERERRRRGLIERCLQLDPLDRPADLGEVCGELAQIELDWAQREELDRAAEEVRVAKVRRGRARFLAACLLMISGALGTMWALTELARRQQVGGVQEMFRQFRMESARTTRALEDELDGARAEEKRALGAEREVRTALEKEQSKAADELASVYGANDRLFAWVLERGAPGIPALVGREGRLAVLREALTEQLAGVENRPGLEAYATRLKYQLGELELAAGRVPEGRQWLAKALAADEGKNLIPKEERALTALRLAVVSSEKASEDLEAEAARAQQAAEEAWAEGSVERLRAEAVLALIEARRLEKSEAPEESVAAYELALQKFADLKTALPDLPGLRSRLAGAYRESALAAEGLGALDAAAELRGRAADEYLALAKKLGRDSPEAAYQQAAALAAKSLAEWGRGDVFAAEKLAREARGRLQELVAKNPGDFRMVIDLASQEGVIATSLRDEGRRTEAEEMLRESIGALEAGLKKDKVNWKARYLLSSLKWQLSSLLGQSKKREEEVRLGVEAHDELKLILDAKPHFPRPDLVRKSLAYLCGDLGMAAYSHGQKDQSVSFFKESRRYWQELMDGEEGVAEYHEGFQWVSGQLKNLGVE